MAVLFFFLFVAAGGSSCEDGGQDCLSWWKWDTPEGCKERGCCVDGLKCHNSFSSPLRRIHVVQGCHFDAGFVASITDILNRWFHEFFPLALRVGSELEASAHGPDSPRLRFTAQSWIVHLFLNCPKEYAARGLLCPSQQELQNFSLAVKKGYITWHAFPFNGQAELSDVSMFDFGLKMTHSLDEFFNLTRKTVLSQRDVPGMTKNVIPILFSNGVRAVSVGVNGGSAPPNVPKAFVWKFNSTMSLRAFWLGGGYAGFPTFPHTVSLTQVGTEAMVLLWRGDNRGPPLSSDEVRNEWKALQLEFPGVEIISSTFDDFVTSIEHVPDALFPQIDSEIADTWIYGAASDPVKFRDMRILFEERAACSLCSLSDPRFFQFSVLALKNLEHTWGRDHKVVLGTDVHANWTNAEFQANRGTEKYLNLSNSWTLQYNYGITDALSALDDHPLRAKIEARLAEARQMPDANLSGWKSFFPPGSVNLTSTHSISFDVNGRVSAFSIGNATVTGSFVDLIYTTYSQESYKKFASEYNYGWPLRLNDEYDFLKQDLPEIAVTQQFRLKFKDAFVGPSAVLLRFATPDDLVVNFGAAPLYSVLFQVDDASNFRLNVIVRNKTSTRMPESTSVRFSPLGECTWSAEKLGNAFDPQNVAIGGAKHLHAVESVSCGNFSLKPGATLVSFGTDSSFPTPINFEAPKRFDSVFSILHDNLWNTNYIGWFPFADDQQVNYEMKIRL